MEDFEVNLKWLFGYGVIGVCFIVEGDLMLELLEEVLVIDVLFGLGFNCFVKGYWGDLL